jgi:hypothetical protein
MHAFLKSSSFHLAALLAVTITQIAVAALPAGAQQTPAADISFYVMSDLPDADCRARSKRLNAPRIGRIARAAIVRVHTYRRDSDTIHPATLPPCVVVIDNENHQAALSGLQAEVMHQSADDPIVLSLRPIRQRQVRAEPAAVRTAAPGGASAVDYVMVVLITPADGQDAAFNRWYEEQHIPDVLKVRGVFDGQLYGLVAIERNRWDSKFVPPYLAHFNLATASPRLSTDQIDEQIKNGITRSSAAIDVSRIRGGYLRPIADAVVWRSH